MTPAMCCCGKVWLLDGVTTFHAEGSEHARQWCRRSPSPALDPSG